MPKQAKKPSKRNAKSPRSRETRSTDALTIGWMLMVMTTLACEVGFLATRGIAGPESEGSWAVLMAMLLFASTVIGLGALVLTPVVVKVRRDPPPRGVIIFSVVVGIAPWALIMFQMANS
jgi:hypothetical protein